MGRFAAVAAVVFVLGPTGGAWSAAPPAKPQSSKPATAAKPAAPTTPPLTLETAVPVAAPPPPRLSGRRTPPPPPSLASLTPKDIPVVAIPVPRPTPGPLVVSAPQVSTKFASTPEVGASTLPPREAPPPAPARTEVASLPAAPTPTPSPAGDAATAPAARPPAPPTLLRFTDEGGTLDAEGEAALAALAERMNGDPAMRVALRSYAHPTDDPRDARKASLERASAIRNKLISLGVRQTRVDLRALGAQPVAAGTPTDRVEVDILAN